MYVESYYYNNYTDLQVVLHICFISIETKIDDLELL